MHHISSDSLANILFRLQYTDGKARHTSLYYARRVNFWRDILPAAVREVLTGKSEEDAVTLNVDAHPIVEGYQAARRHSIRPQQFTRVTRQGYPVEPRYGRFYPKGLLRDMPGIFPQSIKPFRCLDVDADAIEVEFNHSLAGRPLKFSAVVDKVVWKIDERGGTSIDWMEVITDGPGMQSRCNGKPTDFFSNGAFGRQDQGRDADFYVNPRFVDHVDRRAGMSIRQLYADLIAPESDVLDLMSSWNSHLPSDLTLRSVTGLGMNRTELDANGRLDRRVVRDINRHPVLPFEDETFDAAVCSLSVEYLTDPLTVFNEVARVLKSQGVFVVTFSNRWFPPKVIELWTALHEFERMGLVLEYFLQSGRFTGLETFALRGYPRPIEDKYFPQIRHADPVYAVWGRKKKEV